MEIRFTFVSNTKFMAQKKRVKTKAEICAEYCLKHAEKPDMTVAKIVYQKHPALFSTLDAARACVRRVRGHAGEKDRKYVANKFGAYQPIDYNFAPFESIPDSYEIDRTPYIIPQAQNNILVLSDIHFPYHNIKALKAAIDYGTAEKVNTIYLNGDILDMHHISKYDRDPTKPKIQKEFEMGRWFLDALRKQFPNAVIYWKLGNHDLRWEHWLKYKSPEVLECDEFKMSSLLRFGEHGVIEIGGLQLAKAGHLTILHGHEFRGSGGVNPARWLFLKAKSSAICGHFHRTSSHLDANIEGKLSGAWSAGCLCELSPDYMPYGGWNHGFAIIRTFSTGDFEVDNKIIVNGKVR